MSNSQEVKVKISITQNDLDEEELDTLSQDLLLQIRVMDEVEDVEILKDENPPDGSMAINGFLVGQLLAVIKPGNIKSLFLFLHKRFTDREIELTIESGSKKIQVKVGSQQDLKKAIGLATKVIEDFQ